MYLFDLAYPARDARVQRIEEVGVLDAVGEVVEARLAALLRAPLDGLQHQRVDLDADLGDLDVLLQVQEAHLHLGDALLHLRRELVARRARRVRALVHGACKKRFEF